MFTAVLFIIAKIWKQPKCPPRGDWIKKMKTANYFTHALIFSANSPMLGSSPSRSPLGISFSAKHVLLEDRGWVVFTMLCTEIVLNKCSLHCM